MIEFFVYFLPLVKSNERQLNCLPLMISHVWNHAEPDHVSCAQHLEVTYALKKLNRNRSCSWLSSVVSLCLIFHWLDLLMDFYCRNRCWIRKEIFDYHYCSSTFFSFIFYIIIWIYCNDTQLMQIARNQNLGKKKEKKTQKNIKRWPQPQPRPRPHVLLTPKHRTFPWSKI